MLYYTTGPKDKTTKRITHTTIEHLVLIYAITDIKTCNIDSNAAQCSNKRKAIHRKDSNPAYLISNASFTIPDKSLG